MSDNKIHIALATDENYFYQAVIAIKSLIETNDDVFHIHLLSNNIPQEYEILFEKTFSSDNCEITIYQLSNIKDSLGVDVPSTISIVSYARLFLPTILPKSVDRVIYVDCDILFNGRIRELYETPLDDELIGGVHDLILSNLYKQRISISNKEPYLNAGILLIPLDRWRVENLQNSFLNFLLDRQGKVFHHDQGIINAVCAGRKKIVSPKFNVISNYFFYPYQYFKKYYSEFYTQEQYDEAKENPLILHFTGIIAGRPWEEECCHPYRELFKVYQDKTIFKDRPLLPKNKSILSRITLIIFRVMPFSCYALFIKLINRVSYIKSKR